MRDMGFPAPSVAVIPEAVDTSLFDPEKVSGRRSLATSFETSIDGVVVTSSSGPGKRKCFIDHTDNHVRCERESDHFQFLSIFKWEYRKGWDVLLLSYWKAFSRSDRVVLRIRSYLPSSDKSGEKNITLSIGGTWQLSLSLDCIHSLPIITMFTERFASLKLGRSLSELAWVVWEAGPSPDRRYPYR